MHRIAYTFEQNISIKKLKGRIIQWKGCIIEQITLVLEQNARKSE